ncbi:hypothetical protein CH063_04174 [Colletotrichum higginsianum]|uniref:Uncharacterized protein n=2 Tax=Colletotrichum higginsianum TaxID=80884 RepID=H1W4S1_COLHI|nr:hypothetical protein CH63R_12427 [Colletotrichum higginsianum IMI 349063]OBR03300.1 hypothetical protein CH63R_12427 [Colletotrichum higginsianum IMI 349063]TIC89928.1 hypothetical protein CH35J_012396 [Colletotrichum higginsianum]GJD02353.1 hypothetical protein ColKHC_11178 [Colletotrichum higginsianum]CCF47484.1 hypothetical protein CH063_04174 [Colletotrichum higginsianum]
MDSFNLFYSPTAALQHRSSPSITNGFALVSGLRVPERLSNRQVKQQTVEQPFKQSAFLAKNSELYHSPTAELQRGTATTGHRLVNGYRVPERISRRITMPLPFADEPAEIYSPTAALLTNSRAIGTERRRINNLRVPPRLSGIRQLLDVRRRETSSLTAFKPEPQPKSWLYTNEPIISSPTAALLQAPQLSSSHITFNGLRIPHRISRRQQTTGTVTSLNSAENMVLDVETPGVLQERSLNDEGRATHIFHSSPSNMQEDGTVADFGHTQLCHLVGLAINRLHEPLSHEDRQILRQILGYLDHHRHDLVALRISVESNAPEVTVPETSMEVAYLAHEAIRTLDYPYLLRVIQALEILSSGIWYTDLDEEEINKEKIPLEFI